MSRGFGSPRQRPTSMQKLVLNRLHVLLQTRSALEWGHRHSVKPGHFEETQGPPRLLGHPLHTCRGAQHPAGTNLSSPFLPLRRSTQRPASPSRNYERSATGMTLFRGHSPTAHMFVRLRIDNLITEAAARLTTGSGGLAPGRAGFAPAGQQTKFHGVIAIPPIPIDQQGLVARNCNAWSPECYETQQGCTPDGQGCPLGRRVRQSNAPRPAPGAHTSAPILLSTGPREGHASLRL